MRTVVDSTSSLLVIALFVVGVTAATTARADQKRPRIAIAAGGVTVGDLARELPEARGTNAAEIVDITDVHRALTDTFFTLDARRPNGWPRELEKTWDDGVAACRARGHGKPFSLNNKGAWLCSRQLAPTLLQLFYDQVRADEIIVVSVYYDEKKRLREGSAERFSADSTSTKASSGSGENSNLALAVALVEETRRGGRMMPRKIVRELPTVPTATSPELLAGEPVLDLPVQALGPVCPSAQVTLAVEPKDAPLARTLTSLYARSLPPDPAAASTTVRCDLRIWEVVNVKGPLAMTKMRSFTTSLQCDGMAPIDQIDLGISPSHTHKQIAPKLASAFVAARCGAEPPR
jgi:hypothetical protein